MPQEHQVDPQHGGGRAQLATAFPLATCMGLLVAGEAYGPLNLTSGPAAAKLSQEVPDLDKSLPDAVTAELRHPHTFISVAQSTFVGKTTSATKGGGGDGAIGGVGGDGGGGRGGGERGAGANTNAQPLSGASVEAPGSTARVHAK